MNAKEKIDIETAIKFLERNELTSCHAVLRELIDEREQAINNLLKENARLKEELAYVKR